MGNDWKWHVWLMGAAFCDMSKDQAADMLGIDPDDVIIEPQEISGRVEIDYWIIRPRKQAQLV